MRLGQRIFCKAMNNIKTFIFMDLETTGLPLYEHNKTKITELCLIAVQAGHIELGCWPRVLNKLNICLYPNKIISEDARKLTGLSNDLLEHQPTFTSDTVDLITIFLNQHRKPICLVAHNGNKFDFPIFKAELHKASGRLADDILCVDSLEAFRDLDETPVSKKVIIYDSDDEFLIEAAKLEEAKYSKFTPEEIQKKNETTPKKQIISANAEPSNNRKFLFPKSYKLGDVFTRLTNKLPSIEHEAEADVAMLIHCTAFYAEKFVEYAKNHAKPFADIPMMRPGVRIGE